MIQKRFVSWAAVSSEPQAKKVSLRDQKRISREHIQRHNGLLVAEFELAQSRDIPEFSEAAEQIEEYAELRKLILSRAFDVLICYTRSRLGRTLALIETIAERCRRAGILIYETDTPPSTLELNNDNDTDLLTGAVRSWKAQQEVGEMRRRHAMGMMGRFKRGEFQGSIPWGWETRFDEKGNSAVIVNPIAAHTIRTALIDLYLNQGWGAQYIVEHLNRYGLTNATGKQWRVNNFNNLFRLLYRYAGYAEINKISEHRPYARTKGNWPPIISEEELQRLIDEREARRGKHGSDDNAYRFSRMVWCAHCNARMIMHYSRYNRTRTNGTPNNYFYKNAVCRKPPQHAKPYISFRAITQTVRDFFVFLQDKNNWEPYLIRTERDTSEIEREEANIQHEIKKAEQAIYDADDKLIDGTFDSERHRRQVTRQRARILHLQAELTKLIDRRMELDRVGRRELRLEEIAQHGLAYLEMEDERAANAKLRHLIQIWVRDGCVEEIEVL